MPCGIKLKLIEPPHSNGNKELQTRFLIQEASGLSKNTNCNIFLLAASCGNDKNATFGCGVNCGKRCSNYNKGPVFCADVCYNNSCDCKDGFVFDDYRGFCVLPDDCSK